MSYYVSLHFSYHSIIHCGELIACSQRCDVSENSIVGTSEVLPYLNVIELTLLETSTDTKHQAP